MLIKNKYKPVNIVVRDYPNGTCCLQRFDGSVITVLSYRNDLANCRKEIERIDKIEGIKLRQRVRSGDLLIKP